MFLEINERGEPTGWHPWHFVWALLAFTVFVYGVGWLALGERVMTAGIRGAAQAHIQKESSANRIAAQARFATDLTSVVRFNQQYDDATKAITDFDAQHPPGFADNALATLTNQRRDLVAQRTGIQQQCQNTIQDYQRAGASYLSEDFKSAGFPDTLGIAEFCQGKPVPKYTGVQ